MAIFVSILGADRHTATRQRMRAAYWSRLEGPFRHFVLGIARRNQPDRALEDWSAAVFEAARSVFAESLHAVGDRGAALRLRAQAELQLGLRLGKRRKEWAS
jgi:hypothetical protein